MFSKKIIEPSQINNINFLRPLVFTNGVFDILHVGHVDYLEKAASFGKTLVVGVNNDNSVRGLGKGEDRPINTARDRSLVLAGLSSVDYVVIFPEQTPLELIKLLKPDVYVKGGDYKINELPEKKVMDKLKGVTMTIPVIYDNSSTKIINKIRGQNGFR